MVDMNDAVASPGALQAGPAQPLQARDAIIYLSGLTEGDAHQAVDDMAMRMVQAFENNADSADATFNLQKPGLGDYRDANGRQHQTRRITLCRRDGPQAEQRPIADIFGFDYRSSLVENYAKRIPIFQLLATIWTLLTNGMRLLSGQGKAKSSVEKWQVRIAWMSHLIMLLYVLILAGALLDTIIPKAEPTLATALVSPADPAQAETASAPEALRGGSLPWLQMLVVWITAGGMFFHLDLKALISRIGMEVGCASSYLTFGEGHGALQQQFSALLNHIQETKDENNTPYRHIHVIGYSFGSIVSMDALFPPNLPSERLGAIKSLTTIGCPFDFIRTYWPDYFTGRRRHGAAPSSWLNIYGVSDVLGSNFADADAKTGHETPAGVQFEDPGTPLAIPVSERYGPNKTLDAYGYLERIFLVGFKAHRGYWETGAPGCFNEIAKALYDKEWPLQ